MRVLIAVALLPLAVPAFAQANQVAAEAASTLPDSQKKVCKVDPEDTESRIRRRICKTEAEWAAGKKRASGRH